MTGRQDMRDTAALLRRRYPHVFRHVEPAPVLDVARIEQARLRRTGRRPSAQMVLDLTPRKDDR